MPIKSRKKTAKKRALNRDETKWFLTGAFSMDDIGRDEDRARTIWGEIRSAVLSAWVSLPGSRPFAWWKFEAPEPRLCITDKHIYDVRPSIPKKYCFGLPVIHDHRGRMEFETEHDYLVRLGLLLECEEDIPAYEMKDNSADYIRRDDTANINKVLRKLGFE
jgi:hypothetical protein